MNIIKRDGRIEEVKFDKILKRIKSQCNDLKYVDAHQISQSVISNMKDNMTTSEADNLICEICASNISNHYNYSILASRIAVTSLHKETNNTYKKTITNIASEHPNMLNEKLLKYSQEFEKEIESLIDYSKDFNYDYLGIKTLLQSYLIKDKDGRTIERPQQMLIRVAISLWEDNFQMVKKTYNYLSNNYFIHATPNLYNAGTNNQQLSSCFLLLNEEDSINGIFNSIKECALISKDAGGIGLAIHNIRAKDSVIKSSNGKSDGIVPFVKILNETARAVNQQGKRKGAFAIYLETWHADIFEFLELKKNQGKEELRARDLFYAVWISDYFMECVKNNDDWYLMCPSESQNLFEYYGSEFKELYLSYVAQGKYKNKIKAKDLYLKIIESQIETGTPYVLFKDNINHKNNQKNLGTIKSSNLCAEIVEYTDKNNTAVCNLASISLPKFLNDKNEIDYDLLKDVAFQIVLNLNQVIDINKYPSIKAKESNTQTRPIGIGVQGLADLFAKMKINFISKESKEINRFIFETIQYGSHLASVHLAKEKGAYIKFEGSPMSEGKFQHDLWNEKPIFDKWDWETLKNDMITYGLYNSLHTALMPTASTSQILGNNESFEPFTSNMFVKKTLSGNYIIINKHLINDLCSIDLWNDTIKKQIIQDEGSVQNCNIPSEIKERYKIVWEIKQKDIIDMSADRSPFIDQSQSLNLYFQDANVSKLSSALMYGWEKGLKTGCYYLRNQTKNGAIKSLGIDMTEKKKEFVSCSLDGQNCESCSG